MASLTALREGIADRLATIADLNVYAFVPDTIVTPAVTVAPAPDTFIQWDTTQGGQTQDYTFVVTVFLPRGSDEGGQSALDAYLAGSGSSSVKAAVEGDGTLGGVAEWLHVTEARNWGRFRYNEIEYYGCEFLITVSAM
ncbi:MAG: hypothetical protein ACRD0W_24745 [Acidimicrobiales bacterium]